MIKRNSIIIVCLVLGYMWTFACVFIMIGCNLCYWSFDIDEFWIELQTLFFIWQLPFTIFSLSGWWSLHHWMWRLHNFRWDHCKMIDLLRFPRYEAYSPILQSFLSWVSINMHVVMSNVWSNGPWAWKWESLLSINLHEPP